MSNRLLIFKVPFAEVPPGGEGWVAREPKRRLDHGAGLGGKGWRKGKKGGTGQIILLIYFQES